MNILITGLTLHNNKGGPALALSLIANLRNRLKDPSFFMVVPDFENNMELEKKWANLYGVTDVIGNLDLKTILLSNIIFFKMSPASKHFFNVLKKMNLIIDLTALSYMDWENDTFKKNLLRNLSNYSTKFLAKKYSIPFIRWTQSYGPFLYHLSKVIVKLDLSSQKYIFIRGEKSAQIIKEILPNKQLRIYPDIAITLHGKETYVNRYLKEHSIKDRFVTISPSSVLYKLTGQKHIQDMVTLISFLESNDYQVILVPHTIMSINPNLDNCDLKVCETINDKLSHKIKIVSEDLDVYNLKGFISKAFFHIGARYHSVIASLSSGVPTISLAWHDKYKDIMDMYEVGEYVFDNQDINEIFSVIRKLEENYSSIKYRLNKNQRYLESKIEENIDLFMEMFNEMSNM